MMDLRVEDKSIDARAKPSKIIQIPQQYEYADDSKLREEFVDYVKDILTKTSGAAQKLSSNPMGKRKGKSNKVSPKSMTEEIA